MYNKKIINIISLIISFVIFMFLENCLFSMHENNEQNIINEIEVENNINKNESIVIENKVEEDNKVWKIIIPSINLEADIKEGTSSSIINSYVGHFEETSKYKGNIGLAAHNRGTNIAAYFKDIKKLKEGDIIIYKIGEIEREYEIETITVIKETDWSYLKETNDNRITLITCVENQYEYRLCVQGIEKNM